MLRLRPQYTPLGQQTTPTPPRPSFSVAPLALLIAIAGLSVAIGGVSMITERYAER